MGQTSIIYRAPHNGVESKPTGQKEAKHLYREWQQQAMDSASEKKNNKMKGEKEEAKKCHCTRKTGEKKEMKRKSNKVAREKGQRQKAQGP